VRRPARVRATVIMDLTLQSPAKINWTLRVVGRRPDGYHDIESLVSTITLFDELAFSERADAQLEVICDRQDLPTGQGNLIWRAASVLAAEAGARSGMTCRLTKRIPMGGGLGGGSSNAATTLIGLNRLWGLHWPTDRLLPLAARLGSDVPLFLYGSPVVISGRGEHVRPVSLAWSGWIVLLLPGVSVSTAEVYAAWHPVETPSPPDIPTWPAERLPAVRWMEQSYNMLERPAFQVSPALRAWRDRAAALAGRPVRMSGSGSTLFTAFDEESQARAFADRAAEDLDVDACVVRSLEQN